MICIAVVCFMQARSVHRDGEKARLQWRRQGGTKETSPRNSENLQRI